MVFTSNLFLFLFLPVFLAMYYLIPFRAKSALILVFSYVFYAWWRPDFCFLLAAVCASTYGLTLLMESPPWKNRRMFVLSVGVTLNLLALGYFKYFLGRFFRISLFVNGKTKLACLTADVTFNQNR